jgi:predicted dehydrogenase
MKKGWLIGTGAMAIEYVKVLNSLKTDFLTIGRSTSSVESFQKAMGSEAISGGVEKFLSSNPEVPDYAIIAVSVSNLSDTCKKLLEYGVKKILLEKPGVEYADEIYDLSEYAAKKEAIVLLAYNRRFYSSVLKAEEIIKEDGGVTSFHFEFTEWGHQVRNLDKPKSVLQNWFLANSTHVIDTAFFLGGKPKQLCCFHSTGMDWHSKSTIFSGAGITEQSSIFSYIANWHSPGRWSIEIMTTKHRLLFKPMEKLQFMKIGSVTTEFVTDVDYSVDEGFKPGLFLQVKAFLEDDYSRFIRVEGQTEMMSIYRKISGY